jgi:hypothetical protein
MLIAMPEPLPNKQHPVPQPGERNHAKTEPDPAVLAEYVRMVEEARSRT